MKGYEKHIFPILNNDDAQQNCTKVSDLLNFCIKSDFYLTDHFKINSVRHLYPEMQKILLSIRLGLNSTYTTTDHIFNDRINNERKIGEFIKKSDFFKTSCKRINANTHIAIARQKVSSTGKRKI